ncbi:haloacid dehalogenase type II [Castellaniella sp.]|uniref:haloacid dehalogenase type II n=1 Tax=Castellaniella sp. TaxID=1955812 RepID=UPI00355DDE65
MALDVARIKTVVMDSYSTLLDVDSAAEPLRRKIGNADEVARLWRAESLMYGMLCNFYRVYEDFYELNRKALKYALKVHAIELPDSEVDDILGVYHELKVFDDVRTGVQALRGLGYPVYVLSNGSPDMLRSLVRIARIDDLITDFISVEEVHQYKPARELYLHGARRANTAAEHMVHISAGWFDVAGAQQVGMQGIWMNRKNEVPRSFGPAPDLVVQGFAEVVECLGGK